MLGKMLEQRSVVRKRPENTVGNCEEDPFKGGLVIFSTCFVFSPRSKQIKRLILLIKELWPKPVEGTVLVVYLPLLKDGFLATSQPGSWVFGMSEPSNNGSFLSSRESVKLLSSGSSGSMGLGSDKP